MSSHRRRTPSVMRKDVYARGSSKYSQNGIGKVNVAAYDLEGTEVERTPVDIKVDVHGSRKFSNRPKRSELSALV